MADQNSTAAEGQQAAQQFNIQRIYVKDLSFESPRTPELFATGGAKPEIKLELNTQNRKIGEHQYEVVLQLTLTAAHAEDHLFLIEVQQAGLFHIQVANNNELGRALGSFCPNLLFPYARELIDSLTTRGGFPPLMLAPVNFDALYAEAIRRRQAEGGAPNTPAH
ncbi:MAG: protein-export chaperone SecB [Pseudomonadota bacterium]|nr:protein-export chaperone SecB [Pseudomonadota bacterium]